MILPLAHKTSPIRSDWSVSLKLENQTKQTPLPAGVVSWAERQHPVADYRRRYLKIRLTCIHLHQQNKSKHNKTNHLYLILHTSLYPCSFPSSSLQSSPRPTTPALSSSPNPHVFSTPVRLESPRAAPARRRRCTVARRSRPP